MEADLNAVLKSKVEAALIDKDPFRRFVGE
jgi:hypothetical protein